MIDFTEFWAIYPRRQGRHQAEKSWNRLKPDQKILDQVQRDVMGRLRVGEWSLTDKRFIPLAATYLNQRRYEDEEHIAVNTDTPEKPKDIGFMDKHFNGNWHNELLGNQEGDV